MPEKPRTTQQNKSAHKWFAQIAELLASAGYSKRMLFEALQDMERDVGPADVKDIFRCIAREKHGRDSTAKLTTKEFQDCEQELVRGLGQAGFTNIPPFPSVEAQMLDTLDV